MDRCELPELGPFRGSQLLDLIRISRLYRGLQRLPGLFQLLTDWLRRLPGLLEDRLHLGLLGIGEIQSGGHERSGSAAMLEMPRGWRRLRK